MLHMTFPLLPNLTPRPARLAPQTAKQRRPARRRTFALLAALAPSLAVFPVALTALVAPTAAQAQTAAPQAAPSGVLNLDASASAEVPADIVRIDMSYETQGDDPAVLAKALNQRTDAALQMAKAQDGVKVRTGAFSIAPSTDRDGKISTWRGRSELTLESRDFTAASRLAGRLSDTLQVGGVSFSLSPEAQQRAETMLSKQAIASFQQQALAAAQAFGYTGFTVREVNIGHNDMLRQPRVAFRALMAAPAAPKMDAVPIEAGTTTVNVTVNGAIQMTR